MAVRVFPLNILGTLPGAAAGTTSTQFKDTFQRANTVSGFGPQWGEIIIATNNNNEITTNINTNLAVFSGGVGSQNANFFPIPLTWMTQGIFNHFAEATLNSIPAGAFDFGPCCVTNLNVSQGSNNAGFYELHMNSAGALNIFKNVWTGVITSGYSTTTLSTLSGATAVVGDVLRLQAVNSGGTWTLTAFKNGVSLGSASDSNLTQGMPSLNIGFGSGSPQTMKVAEFAGGRL